jgi:lipoyl-dependent peroxiredoxin
MGERLTHPSHSRHAELDTSWPKFGITVSPAMFSPSQPDALAWNGAVMPPLLRGHRQLSTERRRYFFLNAAYPQNKNPINPQRRIFMASKASAVWTGSLKEGKGTISTATGVLKDANYSFATRFEGASSGTTPEELIAAAHASCFSMALGAQLGEAGLTPSKIETQAAVTLAKTDAGFAVTKIALTTTASVPNASKEAFDKAAGNAKAGCPISKLFANNTEITLDAKLV